MSVAASLELVPLRRRDPDDRTRCAAGHRHAQAVRVLAAIDGRRDLSRTHERSNRTTERDDLHGHQERCRKPNGRVRRNAHTPHDRKHQRCADRGEQPHG